MSKKDENVIKQTVTALQKAIDELETTNSYLYGIGSELSTLNDTLKEFFEYLKDKGLVTRAK